MELTVGILKGTIVKISQLKPSLLVTETRGLVTTGCKSIDFSKEVFAFCVKMLILVRRSVIFEKKM